MTYSIYIIFTLVLILLLSILLYKKYRFKEAQTANPTPPILKCPLVNGTDVDIGCYDRLINDNQNGLKAKYNYLMARVPIAFHAGNIEYSYDTETPLVLFTGGVPYIYVNMRLPYPKPGDKGDKGDPGPEGETGEKGEKGEPGLSGYSGLSYSNYLGAKN